MTICFLSDPCAKDHSYWIFGIQAVNLKYEPISNQESGKKERRCIMTHELTLSKPVTTITTRSTWVHSSRLGAVWMIMSWAKAGCMALAPQEKKSLSLVQQKSHSAAAPVGDRSGAGVGTWQRAKLRIPPRTPTSLLDKKYYCCSTYRIWPRSGLR